jgi:hypothetical protein
MSSCLVERKRSISGKSSVFQVEDSTKIPRSRVLSIKRAFKPSVKIVVIALSVAAHYVLTLHVCLKGGNFKRPVILFETHLRLYLDCSRRDVFP